MYVEVSFCNKKNMESPTKRCITYVLCSCFINK